MQTLFIDLVGTGRFTLINKNMFCILRFLRSITDWFGFGLGWFGEFNTLNFSKRPLNEFTDWLLFNYRTCEGGVDVVGVVTPLVRGGAQVLHGDQVVELSVLLEVHEKEEEGEDGEGQIEVESERGELKERRTCTWMT